MSGHQNRFSRKPPARSAIARSAAGRRAAGREVFIRTSIRNRLAWLPAASSTQQAGLSLVEVLVAVVLLSIGLLGLAGLQASGMRVGQSSIHRSLAAQLAQDMIERLRANVVNAGAYNLSLGDAAPACASLAACDLRDWRLRLQSLPAGTGAVTVSGQRAIVLVQWDDSRGADVWRGSAAAEDARAALRRTRFEITAQLAD